MLALQTSSIKLVSNVSINGIYNGGIGLQIPWFSYEFAICTLGIAMELALEPGASYSLLCNRYRSIILGACAFFQCSPSPMPMINEELRS